MQYALITSESNGCLPKPHFLLVVFFVALVAVVLGFDVCAYNRVAACRYAQKYWDKVCSDGYFFEKTYPATHLGAATSVPSAFGYDCAHFVSCCVGNEPNEPGGGLELRSRTQAYGEPGAAKLVTWLLQHGATTKGAVSGLLPGDVIAYDRNGDGSIDHVALYLGKNKVAAHSQSWCDDWHRTYRSGFTFIHIQAATKPPPEHIGGKFLAEARILGGTRYCLNWDPSLGWECFPRTVGGEIYSKIVIPPLAIQGSVGKTTPIKCATFGVDYWQLGIVTAVSPLYVGACIHVNEWALPRLGVIWLGAIGGIEIPLRTRFFPRSVVVVEGQLWLPNGDWFAKGAIWGTWFAIGFGTEF